MTCRFPVGVAGFEPAASSSRSQLATWTARAVPCPTWEASSVGVRCRPLLSVVIVTHLVTRSLASRCRGLRKALHSAHLRPGPPTLLIRTTYPCRATMPGTPAIEDGQRGDEGFAILRRQHVGRYASPGGRSQTRRAIDYGDVPFYVDRVSQVTAGARREVADFDMPLPETTGRPVQTPADGIPALLVAPHPPKIVTSSAWDHNSLYGSGSPLTNRSMARRR